MAIDSHSQSHYIPVCDAFAFADRRKTDGPARGGVEDGCPMYVCLCNGFTDRDVSQALGGGVSSVAGVYRALDCKPQCGRCGCTIRDMLDGHREVGDGPPGQGALLKPA